MLWGPLYLCCNPKSIWRMLEWSSDWRVWNQKRSLSYLWRRWRSWSRLQRRYQARCWGGRNPWWCWELLEKIQSKKNSKVFPELGGGQSPKNAKGVQDWSWKNSEMVSEQKRGHSLTVVEEYLSMYTHSVLSSNPLTSGLDSSHCLFHHSFQDVIS